MFEAVVLVLRTIPSPQREDCAGNGSGLPCGEDALDTHRQNGPALQAPELARVPAHGGDLEVASNADVQTSCNIGKVGRVIRCHGNRTRRRALETTGVVFEVISHVVPFCGVT